MMTIDSALQIWGAQNTCNRVTNRTPALCFDLNNTYKHEKNALNPPKDLDSF